VLPTAPAAMLPLLLHLPPPAPAVGAHWQGHSHERGVQGVGEVAAVVEARDGQDNNVAQPLGRDMGHLGVGGP
jgi:hypothetical protein